LSQPKKNLTLDAALTRTEIKPERNARLAVWLQGVSVEAVTLLDYPGSALFDDELRTTGTEIVADALDPAWRGLESRPKPFC
jgi:hypothetical protein